MMDIDRSKGLDLHELSAAFSRMGIPFRSHEIEQVLAAYTCWQHTHVPHVGSIHMCWEEGRETGREDHNLLTHMYAYMGVIEHGLDQHKMVHGAGLETSDAINVKRFEAIVDWMSRSQGDGTLDVEKARVGADGREEVDRRGGG